MIRVVRLDPKYRPHLIILIVTALLVMAAPYLGRAQAPTILTISEVFGVSHPQQIIDFDSGPVDRGQSYMIGPNGTEVPYQVLSTGKIAVQTDFPANTQKSWRLSTGRAPGKFQNSVKLDIKAAYYEITNGITGVRIVRPEGVSDTRMAPIQGLKLRDGRWTATGPNLVQTQERRPLTAKTMTARVLEQGPLQVTIAVTYTYDRPDLGSAPNIRVPGGPGQYQSVITLEAGQPSIQIVDDSDTDIQYYLNFYPEVQQDQGRWRGQAADALEYGRDPVTGGEYRGGLNENPSDAVRELPTTKPYFPYYLVGDKETPFYSFRWMPTWYPWIRNTGWYWMLYNSAAGSEAPLVGFYSGRASVSMGVFASGPAPYGEPTDTLGGTGRRSAGIGFQINRYGPDASVATRVKMFWAIFVGTKGSDLGNPYQLQNIHRQMNLHGGMNLNKAHRFSATFSDPPGGYSSMYMDNQSMDQLIQRIRTDNAYYNTIKQTQPDLAPMLDMWRDSSGTKAQLIVDDITGFAQKFLNVLVNGSGVYDFYYHYWMGGVEMARRAPFINELLRGNQVSAATKVRLKAAMALFGSVLWDDDHVPLSVSGAALGTANMPVQQTQYRYMYALLGPMIPGMAGRTTGLAAKTADIINYQLDADGAHIGATHYIAVSMEPTLFFAQQLKTGGISNPFRTEAKLAKFGQFYMDMQTPPEPRFGGLRKLVSIGDSPTEGSEMFGIMASGFSGDNPSLSSRLMKAWLENGKPQSFFFGPSVLHINEQLPASPMGLRSANYPGWAAILRHGFGTPNESATWFVDGDFYNDHRHYDRGSLVIYALGAPLSMDWGSQYQPQASGSFVHNDVTPESSIGASWLADNIPLTAGVAPWSSGGSTAFESFDLSTRARGVFQGAGGTSWMRTVRTIAPNSNYPVITISDTFSGANAGAGKVFNLNLMAQGAVQSTAGTVTPVLRSGTQLPSTSAPLSLSAGLNRFNFSGQWLIDWDLYQISPETQQVVIGNWSHNFVNGWENNQFQAANGRSFEERQHIFRLRGTSGFNVLILPYRKGTQRSGVTVTSSAGTTTVTAPGEETLINDAFYAYQSGQWTVLTTHGTASASSYGIQISGGPAEVVLTGGKAIITAHGAAGTRNIKLPGSWQIQAPLTISDGVISFNYQGGAPVRVELTQ